MDLAEAGLRALEPRVGFDRWVSVEANILSVGGRRYDLDRFEEIVVLGAGKATAEIAAALEDHLGERLSGGVIAVPPGTNVSLRRLRVLESDHPLPTERSVLAASAMVEQARSVGPHTLVVACFTGGSSALVSLPPPGVSIEDKRELHRLLLSSGMSIVEVNTVRKHVSLVKGGRLARLLAPSSLVNLTVSDVVGDQLDCITDLTVQDTSNAAQARALLDSYELTEVVPPSVISHLESPDAESPDLSDMDIESVIVTRGMDASDAVRELAAARGFSPVCLGSSLVGEASTVGSVLATLAVGSRRSAIPFPRGSVLVACGGECTVTLDPSDTARFGLGGPNQEAAVGAAVALEGVEGVAALFMDTDGSDGGGDVAGGLVDASTARRASDGALGLRRALGRHETTHLLDELGDAVRTGRTGTNANDLVVIVVR